MLRVKDRVHAWSLAYFLSPTMPFLLTDLLLLYDLLRDYFVADTWKIFYASPQLIPTTRFFIF